MKSLKEQAEKRVEEFIKGYEDLINSDIIKIYIAGSFVAKRVLNKPDTQTIKPTKEELEVLRSLVFENIKGVKEDMRRDLSNQLNIGLAQRETNKQLKQRLDDIFRGDNPTKLKYENRLKLIVRTESARIFNAGAFNNAKRLNAKYKYLIGTSDSRQGNDSKVALRKYGSPEKAIPIDDYFEFSEGKNKYKYKFPPNRPNDRETAMYIYEKPNNDN